MIINDRVYFIHIPRTGGRYVRSLLSNNFTTKYDDFFYKFNDTTLLFSHCHYPLYLVREKEMVKEAKFFSIIRDPFEKIISQLKTDFRRDNKLIHLLKDKYFFFDYIEKHRNSLSIHNNWYRPQVDFISKNTFLWHFSFGFKEKFFKWLNSNLNLNIKNKKEITYIKNPEYDDIDDAVLLNEDLSMIKDNTYIYYENDYILSKKLLESVN